MKANVIKVGARGAEKLQEAEEKSFFFPKIPYYEI